MKTHRIEVQRIAAAGEAHGLVEFRIDALVLPLQAGRDDRMPSSVLSLSIEQARVLQLLLRERLAEVDRRKGRSQR